MATLEVVLKLDSMSQVSDPKESDAVAGRIGVRRLLPLKTIFLVRVIEIECDQV